MSNGQPQLRQQRDAVHRINFLEQASRLFLNGPNEVPSAPAFKFGRDLLSVSQRAVLRIDPTLKRSVCKGCRAPFDIASTLRVRVRRAGKKRRKSRPSVGAPLGAERPPAPAGRSDEKNDSTPVDDQHTDDPAVATSSTTGGASCLGTKPHRGTGSQAPVPRPPPPPPLRLITSCKTCGHVSRRMGLVDAKGQEVPASRHGFFSERFPTATDDAR
ncbi:hypothetical protein H696_03080 [Fonticula alba]|uniref:Uncharacterized protein n=1 Tax=Fonticula alba TaxID=691883 RepID=A0A058Z8U2_FONAL|nr:hypothetical protein H696_03080 [Fonticula alba]KCV70729.1 hypothetical protein H696_03080 [Fonticula alba]|eukprot:XP_009495245.1 hypothetical protein H696_03080 [Fonticula alba]